MKNSTLFCMVLLLFAVLPVLVFAQTSVTGRIVSRADQTPIAGGTVLIKGSRKGISSDAQGRFAINAKKGDVLIITGVGLKTQQVVVTGSDEIIVQADMETEGLNEVVVTALGIKKEAKRLGYAVQEVKGEDLVKARDQNPVSGLTGKVAGLSVGPSAEMLRKPIVLLRGNEITLYVVDGVPISSDTWNLSPDDIESYTVLKGPTAAALYGSRASAGAIMISTKKGNKKKGFTVEINSTNSMDKGFIAFPRVQDEYGPGENGLYKFGDGKGGGLNDNDYDVWGPKFEGQLLPQYDSPVDPVTGIRSGTPWIARGKNNLQRFLQPGFQSTNNISLNSSGDNYNIRMSLSHSFQQSIIPNMKLNITNLNLYASYNPTSRLKIEANINYNKQYTPNFPDVDYGPNSLLYNIAVWTGADWNIDDMKNYWQPGKVGTQSIFAEYQRYHNPYFMVYEWLRGHYKTDIYSYLSANYTINKNLNLTARTQITGYDLLRTEKMPFSAHPYGRDQQLGDYREDRRNLFENNTEVQLNYNYSLKKFLNLSGVVGGNIRSFGYNSSFTSTDYLNVPNVYTFSNSKNPIQASNFTADMRVLSAYYSLDATFGKYVTMSTTGRVDQSSAFPSARNKYFYPSVSIATPISDYVILPDLISFLKVRGSYAVVHGDPTSATIGLAPFNSITAFGNSPSGISLSDYPLDYGNNYNSPYGGPDYRLQPVYSTNKPYNNQSAAVYSSSIFDPNIKPFTRKNFEEGFDIRFLKNRLGLSATAFQYVDGPQILSNPISSASGYSSYFLNALVTRKTGYEFSITGTPLGSTTALNWNVLVNWSTYQDTFKELPPGQTTFNTFFKAGDRVDKLYTSAFVRTADGQIVHDAAGKPLNNPVAQYLGNLNADYAWSIYNNFSYKGLSLGFQFDGSVGGVTTDYMHNKTMRGGRNIETIEGKFGEGRLADYQHANDASFAGIYVGDGVVVSNGTPINYDSKTGAIVNYKDLQFATNKQVTHVQDYISKYYGIDEGNLMSKTFAKLREVTIGYTIPSSILTKSFISKITVSAVARNLIYFYKDKRFKDVDLDQYNNGVGGTGLQSPTTRRYGLNVNVVF